MSNPFVSVVNLGCRVNRVESDRMTCDLDQAGFTLVDPDEAELIVINTCAVTGEAEAKTRKAVRHALGRARKPWVVATGCAANLHGEMLRELSDRVVVEPSKVHVVDRACELLGFEQDDDDDAPAPDLAALGRARLGIKVQDGCNNRCTYCIVWKARGAERSVPVEAVLEQVRDACAARIPEVVLTGVNLGAYDGVRPGDEHVEIDELLEIILDQTDIPQVRLSSIEPMDVSDRLLACMASHSDRITPFLHLPVQSGCTETLRRMARPYTAEEFLELTCRIREFLPTASLSCDLIVGFPGESEEEFCASRELCERVGFSRMHVFRYSARPGTPAATMPDQIPPEVMAERSREMRDLAERMALEDRRRRVGSRERVVLESGRHGTTESFHRAAVADAPIDAAPTIVEADIMGVDDSGVLVCRMARDERP
ncbi:MiaB/RimO family radical SAM methylthiotransferase [Collinsella sp. An2]|uniref:MiaB/RimO family radical SAM methylthiotransferase n=1 Tax=Collinsella sp. An2 TaxID=1965585 RepID=UPI000B3945DF|nr:MiaB/RimO family radical SAM methylthiotransferase [Collinsella sp. An2]OUP07825.1 tRNA (N6-isopentenyl adenosine(37)-C2)-methylthiotransferase MiaB [Collinsella sp. An2]